MLRWIICQFSWLLCLSLHGADWEISQFNGAFFGILGQGSDQGQFVFHDEPGSPTMVTGEFYSTGKAIGVGGGEPLSLSMLPSGVEQTVIKLRFSESDQGHFTEVMLRRVQTVHGPALAGQFPYLSDHSVQRIAVIWLDQQLERHPESRPELDFLEVIEASYDLRIYTTESGLAANPTRSITQTPDRYIWVGTIEGLSRFDGYTWKTFRHQSHQDLPDDIITSLTSDPSGRLVIGTKTNGIYFFDGHHFEPAPCNENIPGDRIFYLTYAPDKSLWFLNDDARVICRFSDDGSFESWKVENIIGLIAGASGNIARASRFFVPDSSHILFGAFEPKTNYGIRLFDCIEKETTYVSWQNSNVIAYRPGEMWTSAPYASFQMDGDFKVDRGIQWPVSAGSSILSKVGGLWYINPGQVYRLEGERLIHFPDVSDRLPPHFGECMEDHEGNLWITSATGGVGRLRSHVVTSVSSEKEEHLQSAQVIRTTPEGTLLVASGEHVSVHRPEEIETLHLEKELIKQYPNLKHTAAHLHLRHDCLSYHPSDENELWFGLAFGGLDDAGYLQALKLQTTDRIPLMACRRRDGQIEFFMHEMFPLGVQHGFTIAVTPDGKVWYGTDQGLFVFRQGKVNHWNQAEAIKPFHTHAILVDSKGNVLFGGKESGLHMIAGGIHQRWSKENGDLSSDTVLGLYEDRQNHIWIGQDEGITRLSVNGGDGEFKKWHAFQGAVYGMIEDEVGNLWFGSSSGIRVIQSVDLGKDKIDHQSYLELFRLGGLDGMDNENVKWQFTPSCARSPDGNLLFSMYDGAIRFDPVKALESVSPSEVLITECSRPGLVLWQKGDSIPTHHAELLVLPPEAQDAIAFDYRALTYGFPEKMRYEYRLKPLSAQWTQVGQQRRAWFSKLSPGDYTFEVRAKNYQNTPSVGIAKLSFKLQPYLHQTWLFRLGILFVLLVLLMGFYRWRIGYREQIKDMEKLAAMDQERLRIARDLHDDLGAGLTRIAVSCDAALIGTDKEDPKRSKRIQKAADLSRALAASISELVWSNDPRNDQLDVVIARLRAHVAQVAEESQWRLEFHVDGRLPMELRLDVRQRRHLLLAFKEVIQNIQKHALAKSVCISVTLGSNQTVSNTTLEVRVCDDGCGFELSHLSDRDDGWQEVKTGNGLRNLRDRMQEIEGGVEIVTKMDKGTSVTLAIPVNLP